MRRIAVVLTSFNRKEETLHCLAALRKQPLPTDVQLTVFLTDDASQDGTPEAVIVMFPEVVLLRGDGNLYWNGGMRRGFGEALKKDFDFYLWVNDDTCLVPDAIARLLATHEQLLAQIKHSPIVVGSIHDPNNGQLTYGGVVRASHLRRLRFSMIEPNSASQRCDTMNGNCVLISRETASVVGNISPDFTHAMGDFDYGLRARTAGFSTWVAPGYFGTCSLNPVKGTWEDSTRSLFYRWRQIRHVKGLPLKEWMTFARRHAGPFWPFFWISPYLRMLTVGLWPESRPYL